MGSNNSVTISQPVEGPITRVNVGRLTNCIFAFTLLFLFKNIQVPNIFETGVNETLTAWITVTLPEIFNFTNAYLLIAIIWILTFHIIHQVRKVSHKFLYIHFGMLMTLVFIPVSSLLADNFPEESLFSLFLHVNVILISVFLFAEWYYITRRDDLIYEKITDQERSITSRRIGVLTGTAVFGSILTLFDREGTRFLYIIVLIILCIDSIVVDNKSQKAERKAGIIQILPDSIDSTYSKSTTERSALVTAYKDQFRGPVGIDMLEILMNGVFAFSMTLIVKNIPLPRMTDAQNIEVFINFIFRVFLDAIEFIIVFIILAVIWMLSFEIMRKLRVVDLTFVYLVLIELFFIVFIPVTSGLLNVFSDENQISSIYGLNIIILGLILIIQLQYMTRRADLISSDNQRENEKIKDIKISIFERKVSLTRIITIIQNSQSVQNLNMRLCIIPIAFTIWMILDLQGIWFSPISAITGISIIGWLSGE